MGIRAKTDKKDKVKVTIDDFIDSIIDYKSANQQSAEMLFALKVKLFEHEKVKSCTDKELKSSLRTAKNPITAIKIFDKING